MKMKEQTLKGVQRQIKPLMDQTGTKRYETDVWSLLIKRKKKNSES